MGLLYAVALVLGAGGVLYQTSYPPFFARLVRRDQYLQANSLLSATGSGSFIAGPALGGLLIQALDCAGGHGRRRGVVPRLGVGHRLRHDRRAAGRGRRRGAGALARRAVEGLRFLRRHPYLRAPSGPSTVVNLFSFVALAVVILFASRTLGLDPGQIGLAFGIGAVGGLIGAVSRRGWPIASGPASRLVVGAVLFSAPLAFIPLAAGADWVKIAVLAAVELVGSIGVMLYDINVNSIQTAVTPDPMRSRSAGACHGELRRPAAGRAAGRLHGGVGRRADDAGRGRPRRLPRNLLAVAYA